MVGCRLIQAFLAVFLISFPISVLAAPPGQANVQPAPIASVTSSTSGWVHPTTGNFNVGRMACTIVGQILGCGATADKKADWEEIASMLEARRVPKRLAKLYTALTFYNIQNGDLIFTTGVEAKGWADYFRAGKKPKKAKNTFITNTRANGGWPANVAITGLFIKYSKKGFDYPVATMTLYADANRKAGILITDVEDAALNLSEATGIDYLSSGAKAAIINSGLTDITRMRGAIVTIVNATK